MKQDFVASMRTARARRQVEPGFAEEARAFLLEPSIVRATFAYWLRRV